MLRQSRIDPPDTLQHVIGRGINRQKIFLEDDDRMMFWCDLASGLLRPDIATGNLSREKDRYLMQLLACIRLYPLRAGMVQAFLPCGYSLLQGTAR